MALALTLSAFLLGLVKLSTSEDQLLAVNMMYRHGDRTPVKFYPNDPYQDPALWPNPIGQLTNIGKRQHYELGQWIRNRYNGFLCRSLFNVCCIELSRPLPPVGKDLWQEDFPWQPIPIHTIPKMNDDIAEFKTSCSIFNKQVKKVISEYFEEYDKENEMIYDYLTEVTGKKIENFKSAGSIYGTLHVEKIYNFTLPEWSIPLYTKLKEYHTLSKKVLTYTPKLNRLANGRLFDNIITQFTYFANETDDIVDKPEKFRIFSAHDTELSCILNGLGVPNEDIPYAATIIFELRRTEQGQVYVNTLFKSQPQVADLIEIRGCDKNCDFDTFLNIMKPMSLTEKEFKEECEN
ncbi:hypothetical protein WA026_016754 [Henosepilachna vigintioctopunctata]|uniref:acid phosphatase n=1 Tax=Henosepilachna vigintioctopunctata TaxID=420089 RepID=A0AAW1V311_9CUCU